MQQSMVYQEVNTWPAGERLALATHILQSLQKEVRYPVSEERREALQRLIGIWKTDQIIDEKQIIDEERMRKYG